MKDDVTGAVLLLLALVSVGLLILQGFSWFLMEILVLIVIGTRIASKSGELSSSSKGDSGIFKDVEFNHRANQP